MPPAVYGKIRVFGGRGTIAAGAARTRAANAPAAGGLSRPPPDPRKLLGQQCLDAWSGRSLDDWWTFYEGGTRLVEYLNHAGYNGLMLAVLADGSTIYPSKLLEPTPRYDTGVFFSTAQDPVRKDVLEMLLRLFDREELQLIPAVEFAAPLPELEAIRRGGGPERRGHRMDRRRRGGLVRLVAARNADWRRTTTCSHPRVQEAMLGVLRELAERYARHSFLCRRGRAAVGRRLCPIARPRLGIGRRDDRPVRARHEAGPAGRRAATLRPAIGLSGPDRPTAARGWSGGPRN